MKRMFLVQSFFFLTAVRKRLGLLFFVCINLVIFLGIQSSSNMDTLSAVLSGPSFEDAKSGRVYLPIIWLVIFTLPTVIVGSSFGDLWQQIFALLKGHGYTKYWFGIINVMLILLLTITYVGSISIFATVTDAFKFGEFQRVISVANFERYLDMFLIIVLFFLLTQILSWVGRKLAVLIVPISLIATLYSSSVYNPLSLIIVERTRQAHDVEIIVLVPLLILSVVSYVFLYGKFE